MAEIIGTAGDDQLTGTSVSDSPSGADDIFGRAGNDRIDGRSGEDRLLGGPGDDQLIGNLGDDLLLGEDDDDLLHGGPGDDQAFGGAGRDLLLGGAGDDLLAGEAADDDLLGGEGDDRLEGGAGADNLFGDAGDDQLDGGPGPDRQQGGAGADSFALADLDGTVDEILDFDLAEGDRLDVGALGQAALDAGAALDQVVGLEITAAGTLVGIDPAGGGDFQPVALLRGVRIEQLSDRELGLDAATPVANDDSAATRQTLPVTIAPLANDQGLDADDALRILALDTAGTSGGAVIDPGGLTVTYTPDPGFFGIDRFRYTVTDERGGTDQAEVRVGVLGTLDLAALDGSNGFVLEGIDAGDASGRAVANAGDINGDGFDDLLVGAPGADSDEASGTGEAYVVFGGASGFVSEVMLGTLNGANGFLIEGIVVPDPPFGSVGGSFGSSLHRAGDVNGDGLGDIIIGAPLATEIGGDENGQSFVIFGSSSGFGARFDPEILDGSNGFRLDEVTGGEFVDSFSGQSVSGGGDMNGDGFADVVIDVPETDPTVHVVFGAESGFPASIQLRQSLDGVVGFTVSSNLYAYGAPTTNAGDIDGDGLGDLLLAFPTQREDSPNEAIVVFGSVSGFPRNLTRSELDGENGFLIKGFDYGIGDVDDAGDFNGDGLADFILGNTSYGYGGAAYVVFGNTDPFPATSDVGDFDGTNGFRIEGSISGRAVSGAGDVNGDGFDDVILGAPGGDEDMGEAFVIFGRASGFAPSVDLEQLVETQGFRIAGGGSAVSSAGDVNGDGFADVIVGAPGADPRGVADAGESYVVLGGDFTAAVDLLGGAGDDRLSGTDAGEIIFGAQGDDELIGGGGGDLLNGGAGDDLLAIADPGFRKLLGGGGTDTVRLDGSGDLLDLTAIPDLFFHDVERIDLNGDGNALALNRLEVLNVDDDFNTLTVFGDADNAVSGALIGAEVTETTVGGVTFASFTIGSAALLVEAAVDTSGIVV